MNTLLLQIETTINDFISNVKLTESDWLHKDSPDRWSKKEIIGHLIDSAQINLQRFVRCTFEENFKLFIVKMNGLPPNTIRMPILMNFYYCANCLIAKL